METSSRWVLITIGSNTLASDRQWMHVAFSPAFRLEVGDGSLVLREYQNGIEIEVLLGS
jgi:hypothetical protein